MADMSFHNFPSLNETESAKLTDMCQQNGWLRRGGYAWQDDPYLEEFPYSYIEASDARGRASPYGRTQNGRPMLSPASF